MPFQPIGELSQGQVIRSAQGAWVQQQDGGYLFERRGTVSREGDIRWEGGSAFDYVLLGSATADGTSVTLEVSGILQTHRDLWVVCHGSNTGSVLRGILVQLNGDTGSNYRWLRLQTADNGSPTTTSSQSATSLAIGAFGDDAFLSQFRLELADYSASRNHAATWQSAGTQGSAAGNSQTVAGSGQYIASSPITSIKAQMSVDSWSADSTLKVYGLGRVA